MGLILVLSGDAGSAEHSRRLLLPLLQWLLPGAGPGYLEALHALSRKLAHLGAYAVLGLLWWRTFRRTLGWPSGRAGLAAFGLSLLWAGLDEGHQVFRASRRGALGDVLLDATGTALALGTAHAGWRAVDRLAAVLLWLTLAGGAAALLLHRLLGLPVGWLGATVPLAAAALLLRSWWRGRQGPPRR
jgi:VanZ family protein